MKNESGRIYNAVGVFVTALLFASLFQAGISFAENDNQENVTGTIKVRHSESEYPGLATITLKEAQATALARVQGDILKIELDFVSGLIP